MKALTQTERWMQEQEHVLFPNEEHDHTNCRVCGPGPLGRNQVPSAYDHVAYKNVLLTDDYGGSFLSSAKASNLSEAEVITSEIENSHGHHTIMLDIDMPARLVASSTPEHWHLYIDKVMHWRDYRKLLRALYRAGVIEKGFYRASIKHKATHLRPPWKDKE